MRLTLLLQDTHPSSAILSRSLGTKMEISKVSEQVCREWAVEVDPDRKKCNLAAQELFIVKFIAPIFSEIPQQDGAISKVDSLHFTRIYYPDRDDMGAYLRVRVFCNKGDLSQVTEAMDVRLTEYFGEASKLKITKSDLDWPKVCNGYGGPEASDLFRDFLHNTSSIVCELLKRKQAGYDIEQVLWTWTHFWFNNARGYGSGVIELALGAVTGFMPNI